ncbi:MAG: hypothetical protein ACKPKO_07615, partial [Candidatus Fonsibacter sp.]
LTKYIDNAVQQQQKLKTILEGLPSKPRTRNDLAAKQHKQYDYNQKYNIMEQYPKSCMQLSAEAEVSEHRAFDPMQQALVDSCGLS